MKNNSTVLHETTKPIEKIKSEKQNYVLILTCLNQR